MPIPHDYAERVYAGVLGKLIGVYLGRPFEGWTYQRIMGTLGEIRGYVNERLNVPLIVTDDDISGTFTFLRALPDYANRRDLTAAQIGATWLNYIIERRAILWWGGRGNSTEHTAYLNLKSGIKAPQSGSIAENGKVVAEQIGAQIFIDGWAMVAPGDPEFAADLARRAGSVSHDGEAVYGAMVVAAMESAAFVERDIDRLIDTAVALIPKDSVIYRMIEDVREWHAELRDWRDARTKIAENYGYDKYGGNCHMVPNHALILHALLYGEGDFGRSLMIVNTSGWDTDCNSGNVGCLLGIRNGLAGLTGLADGVDFRTPIADRLYLPTADGGRAITDALTEAYHVINIGRALAGLDTIAPKGGARFHFSLPGSVQGFQPDPDSDAASVENGTLPDGTRVLLIRSPALGQPVRVLTPTFIPSLQVAAFFEKGYALLASPTLYSGQTVRARVVAGTEAVRANLFLYYYGTDDAKMLLRGDAVELMPGAAQTLMWEIPDTGSAPISGIGVEIDGGTTLYLDWLTWEGAPRITFTRPAERGKMWRRAWVGSLDHGERHLYDDSHREAFSIIQNEGRGSLSIGTSSWQDYTVSVPVVAHLCKATGIAARVGGLRRYYALLLRRDGKAQLIKMLDGETVLAEADYPWTFWETYTLSLQVVGNRLIGSINGAALFDVRDDALAGGGVALLCDEGRVGFEWVQVTPAAL